MTIPFFLLFLALLPKTQLNGGLDEAIRLYEKGEFKQAVNLLQQLRSSSPTEPDVRLWLGKSYLKTRDWDNAVKEMEKAVQLRPSNAQYHLWLGRAYGDHASHSIFFKALGLARRVTKEFETARKLAPEDMDTRFDLLEFYLRAPGIVGGGKDKAVAEAQAISKLDPAKGYVARSIIYQRDKKWDLAKKELVQAAIDYPNQADAFKDVADYLLDQRDFEGALEYAKKALALDSESKQARLILAASRVRLKEDLEQAAETLRELAASTLTDEDPSFEEVYYWLGEYYIAEGDNAKAKEAFRSALAFDPDYDRARDRISLLR